MAEQAAEAARPHWQIENQSQHVCDLNQGQDSPHSQKKKSFRQTAPLATYILRLSQARFALQFRYPFASLASTELPSYASIDRIEQLRGIKPRSACRGGRLRHRLNQHVRELNYEVAIHRCEWEIAA
ncbi:hypothetical protein [Novosphingobium sp. PhB55]|uniref:hypothetical protein n=1 Tax=Novosphingobium sp. PhB55 TaxID=2485106 RepID=UPI00106636FD|nr:hypothetical protein [Novosphingobium sp. PhB55]